MNLMRTLVWFRGNDLRLRDHEPLSAGLQQGQVILVCVVDPAVVAQEDGIKIRTGDGGERTLWAARADRAVASDRVPVESSDHAAHRLGYLRQALEALRQQVQARGAAILLPIGKPLEVIPYLVGGCRVDQVFAQRQTDPTGRELTRRLEAALPVPLRLFGGETLVTPGTLRTSSGEPYSVFTPFSKAWCKQLELGRPLPIPSQLEPLPREISAWIAALNGHAGPVLGWIETLACGADTTDHTPPSAAGRRPGALPVPAAAPSCESQALRRNLVLGGEREALRRMKSFVTQRAGQYAEHRDRLDLDATSRLSADLHFGCVSPRQVWFAAQHAAWVEQQADGLVEISVPTCTNTARANQAVARFQTQLIWREFAYSTLWDRPSLLNEPFQARYAGFPWRHDPTALAAWKSGHTGYPVVDAAARQLLTEGFVHNRARMISASFLTKDLLVDFRLGEHHYLEWLMDGDRAQNDLGWQWASGCGCDAQPYFRVFNPVTQAERFDPEGRYVRRYVPELARIANRYVHRPWTMSPLEQQSVGIRIGRDYPSPIVEHDAARKRFLAIATEFLGSAR